MALRSARRQKRSGHHARRRYAQRKKLSHVRTTTQQISTLTREPEAPNHVGSGDWLGVGYFMSQTLKSLNLGYDLAVMLLSLRRALFRPLPSTAIKSMIVIQCFLYSCSIASGQQAVKINCDSAKLAPNFGVRIPAIGVAIHAGNYPLDGLINFISGCQQRRVSLGAQTISEADPSRGHNAEKPQRARHNLAVYLFCWWGWYLCNHWWPWFIGPLATSVIFFLVGRYAVRVAPTPNE